MKNYNHVEIVKHINEDLNNEDMNQLEKINYIARVLKFYSESDYGWLDYELQLLKQFGYTEENLVEIYSEVLNYIVTI